MFIYPSGFQTVRRYNFPRGLHDNFGFVPIIINFVPSKSSESRFYTVDAA